MPPQEPNAQPPSLSVTNISDETIEKVSSEPDLTTADELNDLEIQEKAAKVAGVVQDISERKKYATCIFWLVVGWLGLMGYILLVQGYNAHYFMLSDTVLIAVVTTTTTGVVGLLLVVVKYLFASHD